MARYRKVVVEGGSGTVVSEGNVKASWRELVMTIGVTVAGGVAAAVAWNVGLWCLGLGL